MILQSHPSDALSWALIASPACALALPVADLALIEGGAERLAGALAGAEGFRATLELLVAGGIAGAPSFALVDGDATAARVVLRGETSVTVTSVDPGVAQLTISGAGMATWSERVLEGARSLQLRVPGSTWTLTLEPVGVTDVAAPSSASGVSVVPHEVTPVAEVTLVPSAHIEVPAALVPPPPPISEDAVAAVLSEDAVAAVLSEDAVASVLSEDAVASEGYDFLFGDTIYRTQAGASIRIPNPDPERPGDHDGRTMLASDLGLPERPPPVTEAPVTDAHVTEVTVIAPIPGHIPAPIPRETSPAVASRPTPQPVATLHLERVGGGREPLDTPVLIGRAPSVSVSAAGPRPRLITIPDDKDISRSHVRVAVEGDAVVVTDLASKNGTVVTLPGASPRKLRSGEPTVVLSGTLIDLGGGVSFIVRED